ncbi:MAG: haloacid dehalogenase type II [Pseudomonadota bacterium]|nr:haloacid dehalogenase type II [Pseudomonadota bacterium]
MVDLDIRALTFDVFGTVVDWRGSIGREGSVWGDTRKLELDWFAFADAWRGLYQPAMEKVRTGELDWINLDGLHLMNLHQLLEEFELDHLDKDELNHINTMWHRLDPWPDSVTGMNRLKTKFTLASLSNGNVALIVNMAKRSQIPWDTILGAEVVGHYKPEPQAYTKSVELLGIKPSQTLMVAAHNSDLAAASAVGLKTAFVRRPNEYGPSQSPDTTPTADYNFVAEDLIHLAEQLGT